MELPENFPITKEQQEALFAETLSERIFHGHLTVEQFETVLTAIRDTDINIEDLFLRISRPSDAGHHLQDPDLMASAYEVMLYPSFNAVTSSMKTNKYIGFITNEQVNKVLDTIRDSGNNMDRLRLEVDHVKNVDPELMASAFTKVKSLTLCGNLIDSQEQVNAFFAAIVNNENVKLKYFKNEYHNFGEPPVDVLTEAVKKLVSVKLAGSCIDDLWTFLTKIKDSEEMTLKTLDLRGNYLHPIDPSLVAGTISKLNTAVLRGTNIGRQHLEPIFTAIAGGNIALKHLDIGDSPMSLCKDMDLVASAICKLETAIISYSGIEPPEINIILTAIRDTDDIALKNLDISICEFTEDYLGGNFVKPDLLASALPKLEAVSLQCSRLIPEQSEAVLTAVNNEDTKLKSLDMGKNEMQIKEYDDDIVVYDKQVDPDLFAAALCKLDTACFFACDLTPEHIKALFSAYNEDCLLKNLDLGANGMSSLEPELVASVVAKMHSCFLMGTEMTGDQINALLKQILEKTRLKNLKFSWAEGVDMDLVNQARGVGVDIYVEIMDYSQMC